MKVKSSLTGFRAVWCWRSSLWSERRRPATNQKQGRGRGWGEKNKTKGSLIKVDPFIYCRVREGTRGLQARQWKSPSNPTRTLKVVFCDVRGYPSPDLWTVPPQPQSIVNFSLHSLMSERIFHPQLCRKTPVRSTESALQVITVRCSFVAEPPQTSFSQPAAAANDAHLCKLVPNPQRIVVIWQDLAVMPHKVQRLSYLTFGRLKLSSFPAGACWTTR